MSSKTRKSHTDRPKPHFMCSTEASRAQNATSDIDLHYHEKPKSESASTPQRNQFIRRATQRITILSASKRRESKTGRPKLNISLPVLEHSTKSSPIRLPSPSSKLSSLPEPVKRDPLDSPTATDKPLPSLPVATVASRSPVQRRSLIDATERPLRKSVSPNVVHEWPTLLPEIRKSKTNISKTTSMEKKSMASSVQKPSMSESLIERMRKMNLNTMKSEDSDDYVQHENQNSVHKIISIPRSENTNDSIVARNSSFLDPRDAPRTPGTGTNTTDNISVQSIEPEELTALHSYKVPEAFQSPCDVNDTPGPTIQELRDGASKATPTSSGSYIPRPSKVVPGRDNGNASLVGSNSNSLQLRRTRARIGDTLFDSPSLKIGQKQIETYGKDSSIYIDRTSVVYRQSSLPLPGRLIKQNRVETIPIEIDTSNVESEAHRPDSSDSQHLSTTSEATTVKHDPSSAIEILKQSQPSSDYDDDSHPVIGRSRSGSSATSGTIYAYDEFGSYRLKPVSVSNRKSGPRVRIDDAADSLLLDDKSLAKCHAKRKAYENRYKTAAGDVNTIQPSESLLSDRSTSLEQSTAIETENIEDYQTSSSISTVNTVKVEAKTDDDAPLPSKVAPPISVKIPGLSHSSTGWPLLVSRVAPFADIAPAEWVSKAREKQKSASESDQRSNPPSPTATPTKQGKASGEQSPASAYTLRTALNNSLFGSTMQRPHRSVRTRITMNDYDSPLTQRTTGLRKTSGGLNKSYASQRAAFRSSPPVHEDTQINYAAQLQSILASAPSHHARNSKNDICDANPPEVKNKDSSSSLPTAPGSASTGKGMISNIKGLFHKPSNDKIPKSASHGSLRMNRAVSVRTPSAAFKPSPLRATFNPNTPDTNISAKGDVTSSSTKRKFPYLNHNGDLNHISPQNDTRGNVESEATQPFVTSALEPFEIRDATALAFMLLDKARDSVNPDAQQDYIELAKLLVTTISLSREAEKAMEEAQQAAARAEMEALKTRHSIAEIVQKIQQMLNKRTDI